MILPRPGQFHDPLMCEMRILIVECTRCISQFCVVQVCKCVCMSSRSGILMSFKCGHSIKSVARLVSHQLALKSMCMHLSSVGEWDFDASEFGSGLVDTDVMT
jgi:hypothetical protein